MNAKSAGRAVGALLVVQMTASYIVNFVLLDPLSSAPGGLLANAANSPIRVGIWALSGLAIGIISLAIAIMTWPVVHRHSARFALWIVALAAVSLSLLAVQSVGILCVLSLSTARATTGGVAGGVYETAALLARSLRNWTHYTELVVGGCMYFVFFAALFRYRLVPRVLAGFGLAAVASQIAAVSLPFFGRDVMFPLLAPLGLALLLLAVWLMVRGFSEAGAAGT